MPESAGEKTEQASPKKMEEARARGQFAKSAEVQTVFVLFAGLISLHLAGPGLWRQLVAAQIHLFSHLHDIPVSFAALPEQAARAALAFAAMVVPVVVAPMAGAILAGLLQSRFQAAPEALELDWGKINPITGFQRMFSARAAVPTALAVAKLAFVIALCYSQVQSIINDPIFFSAVTVARIAEFMANAAAQIGMRVGAAVLALAAIDYGYQFWQTSQDLMMTKDEVREEFKNLEGNPQVKARLRRRRPPKSMKRMLADVIKADVVVTNPTHFAIALWYDRKTMRAPKIVAKGSRLHALQIREMAARHQIPIIENKPLARMMFKYGKMDGEVPAQLYAAVAEVLAWVYRVNRYRYYAQQNATAPVNNEALS